MTRLKAISYLSPNLFWLYQEVVQAIARRCDCLIELIGATCDPLDDPLLEHDQVDIAFICGLPLIRHNRIAKQPLEILAVPVMQGDRYQQQPIYFADIVVRADSNFYELGDLAGSRFCYNDRGSNSGYNLIRYRILQHLKSQTLPANHQFFQSSQASGSHQNSLQWIASGLADCAAIDSVVMAAELRQFPKLAQSLRVIDSIPSPIPPIAISSRLYDQLGDKFIQEMRQPLTEPDQSLREAMQLAEVSHYTTASMDDYAEIGFAYDVAIATNFNIL
ncbi:phosphate/phosphite/phosphonate ABC transporter substrate-binding protein [Pseudanabaena mucicola]|uniref:PhnD/SsuA/transferrin family substrate-binding protein n=1 Tax=Pseudanabaena mucicola FACHB-723 TaxID=2692860 RepID=A0ABR8A108_9CYAN|nr:PhnD/SsuA/transferrin family substrate-binding protein [Pseudanabaena mucicola]MBD2189734.1 PhnD/SsuA/transferrin family substrate-binding protein [Pseudanabaena mucicola FACHB-723]